jgi:hypothetical protein
MKARIPVHSRTNAEHLSQIPQAQFIAEPLKHHERYHIARILRPVHLAVAPFVELLRAVQTPEPAITVRSPLRPLLDCCRSASRATHLALPPNVGDRSHYICSSATAWPDR